MFCIMIRIKWLAVVAVLLLSSVLAFGINDAWIGSKLSVRVSFLLHHIAGVSSPTPKEALSFPAYPSGLIESRLGGTVKLRLTVSPSGIVENIAVLNKGCADSQFYEEAKSAVSKWKFMPAKRLIDGDSVAFEIDCMVDFVFDENESVAVKP